MFKIERNLFIGRKYLIQVLIHQSRHNKDAGRQLFVLDPGQHDVEQLDREYVVIHGGEAAEDGDLAIHLLRLLDIFECIFDIFNCNNATCFFHCSFYNLRPLALALHLMYDVVVGQAVPYRRQRRF